MRTKTASAINKDILHIGVLFFVFGFVIWLGSVLIPYLKIACELSTFESYLVAFSFYISYTVMALPAAWVLRKTGSKKGMALGLFIMGIGALIFIPAATTRWYALFLSGLFIQGAGLAILQSASNSYITKPGDPESAATRISIMGICNDIAGVDTERGMIHVHRTGQGQQRPLPSCGYYVATGYYILYKCREATSFSFRRQRW
ncbi:MAG: MFS transporter [Chitinophagaceae bacterium]|nr:MFS transporter [Chitinophagaceae bacterium]